MVSCHTKNNSSFTLHRQLRDCMLKLCGVHLFSRLVFWELFCRAHFGIKYEDLKPNSRYLASSILKRNHKELISNGHIIIIDIELHKLYVLERHYRVNRCVFYRLNLYVSMCFYSTFGRPRGDAETDTKSAFVNLWHHHWPTRVIAVSWESSSCRENWRLWGNTRQWIELLFHCTAYNNFVCYKVFEMEYNACAAYKQHS